MFRPYLTLLVAAAFVLAGGLVPLRSGPATGGSVSLIGSGLAALVSQPAMAQRKRRRSLGSILFGRRTVKRRTVRRRKANRAAVERRAARKAARRAARRKAARRKAQRARTRSAAKPPARVKRRTAKAKKPRRRAVVRRAAAPAAAAAAVASAATSDAVEAPAAPVETKTVMVVGDFYGGGLAFGLARGLDEASGIVVDKRTVSNSGLIRDDVVDWPKRITELAAETKPDFIIVQLGSNDRQLLQTAQGKFPPRSPEWDAAYKKRIAAVAASLKATNVPFLWVGVPPVRFKSMNRDFLVFNEWYEEAAKAAGGKFVDVWDGFTDAEGDYVRSGPDVSGRIVVLRGKGGINMTNRGKDKLGWYATAIVEKALAGPKVFTTLPTFDLGSPEIAKQVYNPARTGRTNVVKLDDPALHGTDGLAGAGDLTVAAPVGTTSAPSGRADDASWPGLAGG